MNTNVNTNIDFGTNNSNTNTSNSINGVNNSSSQNYSNTYNQPSSVQTESMDLSFATEQVTTESKSILDNIGAFFNDIGEGIRNTGAKIVNGAKTVASWAINGIKDLGSSIQEACSNLASNVSSIVGSALTWIKDTASSVLASAATIGKQVISEVAKIGTDIQNALVQTKSKLIEGGSWLLGKVVDVGKSVGNFIVDAINNPLETLKKTAASVANTAVALIQGLSEFGEALVDTGAILCTAISTPMYALMDGLQWLGGKITGNEDWKSITKSKWAETKEFVSTKYVTNAFDSFHTNNVIGKWLDDNAYAPFKSTGALYKIADGVGYIGGIILLTMATMGLGGAAGLGAAGGSSGALATANIGNLATISLTPQALASGVIATTAGFGKNTQNAWADGATIAEGLTYGLAMGTWEGFEMLFGAGINSLKFTGLTGLGGQLATTASHVALDTIDGASGAFINPIMQMIYNPNDTNIEQIMNFINYDENGNQISNKTWEDLSFSEKYKAMFEYNGGWEAVSTQALSAGTMSFLSEIPDIRQAMNLSETAAIPVVLPIEGTSNSIRAKLDEMIMSKYNGTKNLDEITIGDYNYNELHYGKEIAEQLELYNNLPPIEGTSSGIRAKLDEMIMSKYNGTKNLDEITIGDYNYNELHYGKEIAEQLELYNNLPPIEGTSSGIRAKLDEMIMSKYNGTKNLDEITIGDYNYNELHYGKEIAEQLELYNSLPPRDVSSMLDISSPTNSIAGNTNKRIYTEYSDYNEYLSKQDAHIRSAVDLLSEEEKDIIGYYISDNPYRSYKTINSFARNTLFEFTEVNGKRVISGINISQLGEPTFYKLEKFLEELNYKNLTLEDYVKQTYEDFNTLKGAIEKSPLPEDMVLFRGVGRKFLKSNFGISEEALSNLDTSFEKIKKDIMAKEIMSDDAFLSTSATSSAPYFAGDRVQLVLNCEKGTPALDFSQLGGHLNEQEVLLGPGQSFKITGVEKVGEKIRIYADTINTKNITENISTRIDQSMVNNLQAAVDTTSNQFNKYVLSAPTFEKSKDLHNYIMSIADKILPWAKPSDELISQASAALSKYLDDIIDKDIITGYYEFLNAGGMGIDSDIKSLILQKTINNSKKLREAILKQAETEIADNLKAMFGITDPDIVKKVKNSLLGSSFLETGIGSSQMWDEYISAMEPHFKSKVQTLINNGQEPVIWSKIEDDYHRIMNKKFVTIENSTLGEDMYFIDAVYSNWNNAANGPMLEELWGKLSKSYADACCEAINPATGTKFSSIKFLYPESYSMDECFGNLFKTVELPEILSHSTIDTITMTKVIPETMEIVGTVDIDISDIAEYYQKNNIGLGLNDTELTEEVFNRFLAKVKEAM